jgi:rubrerythrin
MLSQTPYKLANSSQEDINKEVLRLAIVAELDAINLYEQLAVMASDPKLKEVFLDVAKEEKTHVGEFQALLLNLDKEQVTEMEKGKEEVDEILSE